MSVIQALRQADIFYELTNTQLELIASICTELVHHEGDVVFEENAPGNDLYVIVTGEVEIQVTPAVLGRPGGDQPRTLAALRRGQSFGEIALVDQGRRSARARCSQDDTRLLVIPRDKLMLLCDSYPQLGYRFMRNLAADLAMKMRNTDLQVREFMTWVRP